MFAALPDGSGFDVTWFKLSFAPTPEQIDTVNDDATREGQRISKKPVSVDGIQGIEVRREMSGNNGPIVFISRVIFDGSWGFQLQAEMGSAEVGQREDQIRQYFESFI